MTCRTSPRQSGRLRWLGRNRVKFCGPDRGPTTQKQRCRTSASRGSAPSRLSWDVPRERDPCGLYWRAGLGAASPDGDAELPVRPADGGGEAHGLKLVGARAQNWLRQEKSYRAFRHRVGARCDPAGGGPGRFVILSKEFHGKAAMIDTGIRSRCVTLLIDGPADADPWGREALYAGDARVGRLTSGGYSVAFGKSIGMGYVSPDHSIPGTKLQGQNVRQAVGCRSDRGQPL